jgi:hypothetical protein
MKFNKVINEIAVDSGEVGHFVKRITPEQEQEELEKEKKEKRKKSRKRVFGSWFTKHNNVGHINK